MTRSYRLFAAYLAAALLLVLITACGGAAEPTPTRAPAPTATPMPVLGGAPTLTIPTATAPPTATTAPAVGATRPAVSTPVPTAVPTPAPTPTPAPAGKRGGVFNQQVRRIPRQFNIDFITSSYDISTNSAFYNGLLAVDAVGNISPDLASDWQWEGGGTKMRFTLLPNLQFHDGTPLTSEDVAWSLNKMMGRLEGHGASARMGILDEYIDDIDAVDPRTVVINLKRPAAIMPMLIAQDFTGITKKGVTTEQLAEKPYGSGAFMLQEVLPGSHIVAEPNPNYHKPGLPLLDGIRFIVLSTDEAALAALATQKVDWLRAQKPVGETWEQTLDAIDGIVLSPRISGTFTAVWFNLTVDSPFRDKRVRQAINLAVEREAFSKAIFQGRAGYGGLWLTDWPVWGRSQAETDAMPGIPKPTAEELAQAKQLMADAGYPDGFEVEWVSARGSNAERTEWLSLELAEKLGIRGELKIYDDADWDNYIVLEKRFTIISDSIGFMTSDPDEKFFILFATGGPRNNTGYSNPEVDRLALLQSQELDEAKRVELVRQIEDIILEDLPAVPLAFTAYFWAWWEYVKDYDIQLNHYWNHRHDKVWLDK